MFSFEALGPVSAITALLSVPLPVRSVEVKTEITKTPISVVVPFEAIIENQSFIVRVCGKSENANFPIPKVKLDNIEGSILSQGQNCYVVDWAVALTAGTHTVSIGLDADGDVATTSFVVSPGDVNNWGQVGAGNYRDWSILRHRDEKTFSFCSLSLGAPIEAFYLDPESREHIEPTKFWQQEQSDVCFFVMKNTASLRAVELNIKLSNGRWQRFLIEPQL